MAAATPATGAERPILPWRLVAGAFAHFILPAYLIAALAYWQLWMPAAGGFRWFLPFSGWFLLLYTAAALLASLSAAGLDGFLRRRRARREAADPAAPARRSQVRVADAARLGKGRFGGGGDAALEHMLRRHWDHDDLRFQALSADLAEVVRRSAEALAHATEDGRPAIIELACAAIDHVGQGLEALQASARDQAESEARTVARYVELRYGDSDFSGEGD